MVAEPETREPGVGRFPGWHIAQINIATALYDLDDPRMAEFVDNLDRINGLAEASPGFVWRFQDESGNATNIQLAPDPRLIVNLTVWETIEDLHTFAYKSDHTPFIGRRHVWFEKPTDPIQALWWVPEGGVPIRPEAGLARLQLLRRKGPGPNAFTFKHRFDPPIGGAEAA